jgi:UDP-N-acetylglucosamine 2-epimerase (non-hydrolysing)
VDGPFVLATIHRQESTDNPEVLARIIEALSKLSLPVVLPAHPRLKAKAQQAGITLGQGAIEVQEPLAYRDMVAMLLACERVVTDSGGLQKEAFLAGRVCSTIRTETEWVETLQSGWNTLISDLSILDQQVFRPVPPAANSQPYGDGHASEEIVALLQK